MDDPESSKLLDVWEDTNLLEFLKTGLKVPGISQSQAKRIHRIAPYYKFYNNKLYYSHNPKLKDYSFIIPKPNGRALLVEKTHKFGQFKLESNYNQLKNKYFWKNMKKTIQRIINNCLPCLRNDVRPTLSHPVLVLRVLQIFDLLGID